MVTWQQSSLGILALLLSNAPPVTATRTVSAGRRTMAMVPTSGAEMLGKRRWAVVGGAHRRAAPIASPPLHCDALPPRPDALNQAKPAYRVAEKLREAGKDVVVRFTLEASHRPTDASATPITPPDCRS